MDFDYRAFSKAAEVFRAVSTALNDLQVYTEKHPHFQESLETAHSAIQGYFESYPESRSITFTVRGERAEFRKVPLVNTGAQGARLVKVLKAAHAAGLQIQQGISAEGCRQLVASLIRRAREGSAGPLAGHSAAAASDEAGDTAGFRLVSEEEARRIQLEIAGYAEAGCESEQRIVPLGELSVSDASLDSLLASHHVLISNLEAGNSVDIDLIRSTTDQAVALARSSGSFSIPGLSRSYFDDFTFHHSVNVCLLATQLISMATSDEEKIGRISLAALLHDAGKMRIPREILHKPGPLTDAEFAEVQKHPLLGADILLSIDGIDPLCVSVAFGHHLHGGGRSYPLTKTPYQGDWVTRLVSVVDIYEALTSVRPYKKGLSPSTAFEVMLAMPGLQDKKPYVKMLYDSIGPFPLGTYVELSTGERAMVVGRSERFPRRPKVCVLTDPEGNRLPRCTTLDLADMSAAGDVSRMPTIRRSVVPQAPGDDPLEMEIEPEPREILGASILSDADLMAREG
ncbi:MAG: HD domain-containing protein [Planctomycetes bacterium]|nr:HD domain-containing protein [Planctomycetota bacterium]